MENVVIIGSGPAAWTAAIYAARANLAPLVFEGEPQGIVLPGGQLMTTTEVENYPGFPEGVTGPDLMERMKAQALRFGVRVMAEDVKAIAVGRRPFTVTPNYSAPVQSHTIIVATGAYAKWIGVPNEERLAQAGGGVSACAVCDGALPFYRNKVLAVVGGGDTAMEETLYLTKFAKEVQVIHRRDSFRASKVMAQRVLEHPKVRVLWNTRVVEVIGQDEITALRIADTVTGAEREVEVGGLFVAIGHTPNTGFLGGQLKLTDIGYLWVKPGRMATSVEGVFAAGDVTDDYYRQAVTAAGSGCQAALEAERYMAHRGLHETIAVAASPTPAVAAGH